MRLVRQRGWEALDVPEFPKARFEAPATPLENECDYC